MNQKLPVSVSFKYLLYCLKNTICESLLTSNLAMYMKLISLLIDNLQKNIVTTKRDLYYQDVSLFQNQGNVDIIIENLCKALGFTNQELGAVAAQKGLCFGDLTLIDENGSSKVFTREHGSFLIPRINGVSKIMVPNDVEYILVVEKDAIFNLICDPNIKRIIITGKGFPDVLTRRFLNLLSSSNKNIPVLGIADIDPYGFNILKQYKSGGDKSKCYLVNSDQNFDCPNLKMVDITILDFIGKSNNCIDICINDFTYSSKLLESNFNEIGDISNDESENKIWTSELQRSMFLGKKAEIDVLRSSNGSGTYDLSNYINRCIEKKLKLLK